jgi:hypothetical protein
VAADGSGDSTTISAAVALAGNGDTVLVGPGTYREHVVIDQRITLRGEPGSDQTVIEFGPESPTVDSSDGQPLPNAIRLLAADATVSFLTIRGPDRGIAVHVSGGAPLIDNLAVELAGDSTSPDGFAYRFTDGTTARLSFTDIVGGIQVDGAASPTIESVGLDGPLIVEGMGSDPDIHGSTLGDVRIRAGARPELTGNTIVGAVEVTDSAAPTIGRNLFQGETFRAPGIAMRDASPTITANTIRGQVTGIEVGVGAAPTIEANLIEDNFLGIVVIGPAAAIPAGLVIEGNTFCGNDSNLVVPAGSELTLEGNTVCDSDGHAPSGASGGPVSTDPTG